MTDETLNESNRRAKYPHVDRASTDLRTVPFHGDEIVTFERDGAHFVAMRRIVENIELDWARQSTKLLDQKDKFSCCHMPTTGADGKTYSMLCMPIEKLQLWLACINPVLCSTRHHRNPSDPGHFCQNREAMTEPYQHAISGLLQRRAELQTETAHLRERMAVVANDIEAIDRVLDSFGFTGELEGKTTRQARIVLFYRNELRAFLLTALRKAGRPMSTRELAKTICETEGKHAHDRRLVADVVKRAGKSLRELRRHGEVASAMGAKGEFVWSILSGQF